MNKVSETDIPMIQDSYSAEELKLIRTGYKRIENFSHPEFSLKAIKRFLAKYKKVMSGKNLMKIYLDPDDYKWKWNLALIGDKPQTTIVDFFV
jgi:hypothetical protein